MNFKMADFLPFLTSVSLSRWQGGACLFTILCVKFSSSCQLTNCSSYVISFLAACVWCVTARTFRSRGQEKAFAGGELSSIFILLLHFLGSCDVNASCFPTSKSLGSQKFSAAIIWFVVYTYSLFFSCWGVLMAACHTFDWCKDNVGQQCWPQLGETTNSCPGNI
jgi:hypothetical protein